MNILERKKFQKDRVNFFDLPLQSQFDCIFVSNESIYVFEEKTKNIFKISVLCKTQNALQLPVFFFFFFFFCQPYPGLRSCKTVFLILKFHNMADRGD